MAILDSQGRLFGKLSILDVAAALIMLLVLVGIFFFQARLGRRIGSTTKPIEVDAVVRGLSVRDPSDLVKQGDKTNVVIRNQPAGQMKVQAISILPRTVLVPQPDGSVKSLTDPRPIETVLSTDLLLTLTGSARITSDGPVLGEKIKIGSPLRLEGMLYDFNASVIDVRVPK